MHTNDGPFVFGCSMRLTCSSSENGGGGGGDGGVAMKVRGCVCRRFRGCWWKEAKKKNSSAHTKKAIVCVYLVMQPPSPCRATCNHYFSLHRTDFVAVMHALLWNYMHTHTYTCIYMYICKISIAGGCRSLLSLLHILSLSVFRMQLIIIIIFSRRVRA